MTIVVAFILFGILIFIHELGHFLLAKKNGVKIHEFAIGMGPKLYSIKRDTEYSIRLLPLGGYVSMEGEDGESRDPRSFGQKSVLQRASILFAGPFFNIVLAVILLIPVYMYIGSPTNTLGEVMDGTPAQKAGIEVGDTITYINDEKIESWDHVSNEIGKSKGEELEITVERNGETKEINVTPENKDGSYLIGISPKYEKNIFKAITTSFEATFSMIGQMLAFLGQLVTGTVPGGVENAVTGPVGVIGIVSDAAKAGIPNLLMIASMISLNLGIINLVPLPALDGGRLLLLGIEVIRGGKKIDPEKENMINVIGLGALLLFMVFITYKDILRLF